jgi:hypothetical protein
MPYAGAHSTPSDLPSADKHFASVVVSEFGHNRVTHRGW